jgi:hypothetical protein
MVNEFLSFKDIPAGVVRDEDEFDEFTLLLAQKGVLKKAPQVGEEAPFRLFQNKSFELEPKLRSAAEECNASDLKSKANLHFSIASKYGTDPFDINELELEDETTKERAEKTEEVKTKRSHFLDHAKKHFGYSEINEANVELLLHYLQMLRREAEEDFDISAARVLDKLLTEHHFESLTDKVLTANLSDEDANDTLTEAKIALMELLSILNTSGYRANSMNKTKWMTTDGESKILAWETHINTDEEGSANIDTIITLMQMRRIQGQVKDTTRDLVHARSAKEAGEAAQGGIIEQIKSLTNLADQLMKDRVLTKVSAINSVRTTARMADIMHIYAEIHVLYAKALKRVEGHYTLDDDEISAEDHLKIAREYCDKCRELANKANPIIEAEKPFETMEAARAGVLPTLLPEEEGLVQPAKTVVQSLKDLAEHVDGVAAIAATNLEFFDMLPWITGQILSEEEGGGILESSVPSQLAAILQFVKVILTTNPGLTKSDYSFDKNCDVTNLEEDTNFENLISRAKELAKIKQRSLDERGKRIYPNKILFPLIQLTESFKVLGRSIFAPHWDNPTTSEGKTSKQKYLNLLSKARTLGISSSETNGWPESETDNGTAAFAEFIARFNTTEADIDRAAISTPEEMSEVQTLFEESMERMLELRAFCDKKDGSPVLCAGMIPLDHELGKLCYEAKLAGLNIVKYEQFDTAS